MKLKEGERGVNGMLRLVPSVKGGKGAGVQWRGGETDGRRG